MKIQLAIQGGGAKLTTLLAAASAIQELQSSGRIELTRVVGTSAGAIVGALLAAGVDIEAFRVELTAGAGQRISSSLAKPKIRNWIRTAFTGHPVWKTDVLRSVIEDVFRKKSKLIGKPLTTLLDIYNATGVDLQVVAADLRSPRPIVYKRNGNDKEVVTALMDSAGIPIYFRTWKHGSLVDGGLVQNFPWDELLQPESDHDTPIIGISFASETRDIASNLTDYASALLNTALDSATERSRARLGHDRILTLPSEFDTFDFKSALSEHALASHFSLVKLKTANWFEFRLGNSGLVITEDPWVSTSLSVMGKLGAMYRSQHGGALLKYRDVLLVFTAFTLEQTDQPDVVNYSFTFFTLDKEIYCHSIALSQGPKDSGSFKQSAITLSGPNGELIRTDYLPILDPKTPEKREILLLFDRVLPANSGPYTLRIQDIVQGLMRDLLKDKRDVLFAKTQRTLTPIERVRTILHIPGNFKNAQMRSALELEGLQVEGRAMTRPELIDFSPPAPGWITIGWLGENVLPREFFGPSITI